MAVAAEPVMLPATARADAVMSNWRFCVNCLVLFQAPRGDENFCPRTAGQHVAAGWAFQLTFSLGGGGTGENAATAGNWRLCGKCAALYWTLSNQPMCPTGGTHVFLPSWNFLIPHDIGQPPWRQDQWRSCFNCSAMLFNGYAFQNEYGRFPDDFVHGHTALANDFAILAAACT
jgi:hypothetical protein